MSENLRDSLLALIRSGSGANPAMNRLVDDYASFHRQFLFVGGPFAFIFVALSVFFWIRFKRGSKARTQGRWTFERKVYLFVGTTCTVTALFLAFAIAVNTSTALHPGEGFSLLVDSLGTPAAGTPTAVRYQEFNVWVQSGSLAIPDSIQARINRRLAWQRPKMIVSGLLLIAFAAVSASIWSSLIRKSRLGVTRFGLRDRAIVALGVSTVFVSLVLVLMVIANAKWVLAPLTGTMAFG